MDERTVFVEASDSNYLGQEFNMRCVPRLLRPLPEEILKFRTLANTDLFYLLYGGFHPRCLNSALYVLRT